MYSYYSSVVIDCKSLIESPKLIKTEKGGFWGGFPSRLSRTWWKIRASELDHVSLLTPFLSPPSLQLWHPDHQDLRVFLCSSAQIKSRYGSTVAQAVMRYHMVKAESILRWRLLGWRHLSQVAVSKLYSVCSSTHHHHWFPLEPACTPASDSDSLKLTSSDQSILTLDIPSESPLCTCPFFMSCQGS